MSSWISSISKVGDSKTSQSLSWITLILERKKKKNTLFFSGLNNASSFSLAGRSSLFIIFVALRWSQCNMVKLFSHWRAENWIQDSRCVSPNAEQGKQYFPLSAGKTLRNESQESAGLSYYKGTFLVVCHLTVQQHSPSSSTNLSIQVFP